MAVEDGLRIVEKQVRYNTRWRKKKHGIKYQSCFPHKRTSQLCISIERLGLYLFIWLSGRVMCFILHIPSWRGGEKWLILYVARPEVIDAFGRFASWAEETTLETLDITVTATYLCKEDTIESAGDWHGARTKICTDICRWCCRIIDLWCVIVMMCVLMSGVFR